MKIPTSGPRFSCQRHLAFDQAQRKSFLFGILDLEISISLHYVRIYLKQLHINFSDDISRQFVCGPCELSKAKERYNRSPRPMPQDKYVEVNTDLVGPITPCGFLGERYFFTFTDGATRETETYTGKEKSEWFGHFQSYYAQAQTVSQKDRPVHVIRTDFGAELRSNAVDQWMLAKGILFEPSAPYSQEENGISERKGRTLMERVRSTIIAGGIPDELWPKVLLAMTHVSNLLPTSALNGCSPFEFSTLSLPNLQHLRVLGSTIYVFYSRRRTKSQISKMGA